MATFIINANNMPIISTIENTVTEKLFLNPNGVRKKYCIGWNGSGRYQPNTLSIYRNGELLTKGTSTSALQYQETAGGVFFNFSQAIPSTYTCDDFYVTYVPRTADKNFVTSKNVFMFPNWLECANIGAGFWISKQMAAKSNATSSSAGSSSIPASIKGVVPWVNISYSSAVSVCNTGAGGHLTKNREYANVIYWMAHHGFYPLGCTVAGTASTVGQDGMGVEGTKDPTVIGGTLTGTGCNVWNHNLQSNGIADLVGNRWEWVSGLELRVTSGSSKQLWIANASNTLVNSNLTLGFTGTSGGSFDNVMNNAAIYNDCIPSSTAGTSVLGKDGCWYGSTASTNYSAKRGGCYSNGALAGPYAINMSTISSYTGNDTGFRVSWTFTQATPSDPDITA